MINNNFVTNEIKAFVPLPSQHLFWNFRVSESIAGKDLTSNHTDKTNSQ